jgi:hypothetical protein
LLLLPVLSSQSVPLSLLSLPTVKIRRRRRIERKYATTIKSKAQTILASSIVTSEQLQKLSDYNIPINEITIRSASSLMTTTKNNLNIQQ